MVGTRQLTFKQEHSLGEGDEPRTPPDAEPVNQGLDRAP